MSFILALDQGTTSSCAMLFDHAGDMLGMAQREFRQIFPKPGWVQHDPADIWRSQYAVANEVLQRAGLDAGDVAAIGIANQRETTIVWDRRTGEPIHNAIVWQDRRTAEFCDRLKRDGHAETIRRKTGLEIDAYFSGSKIHWLLDHVDGARARAESGELAFGTVDSWLLWNLTGGALHATDVTNASRTMLLDIHTLEWDDELLELLGVPRPRLPEVRSSSEVCGETARGVFAAPIKIAGVAGDQQAALFGQTCFSRGLAKNTYGTGCFMLMTTGRRAVESRHRLLSTIAWKTGALTEYALEGSVFIGGAVVQWLRDGLGLVKSAADIERLAASVPDNGGVYIVPAFAGLGAPHWDQYARGCVSGITRGTTAGHFVGKHRSSSRRRPRSDAGGLGRAPPGTSRRRRCRDQQSTDAVPGGSARRAHRAAQGDGDDGAWGGLSRGSGRRLLVRRAGRGGELENRTTVRAVDA